MKFETFQIDLKQKGLRMVFKDWEAEAFLTVVKSVKLLGSHEVHVHLINTGFNISRASVINFLDRLVEAEIFYNRSVTGKGGHRGQYGALLSDTQLMVQLEAEVPRKIEEYLKGCKEIERAFG